MNNVSSEISAVLVLGIEFLSLIGLLAAFVADEETRKGLMGPILSGIGFLAGLVAAFVLPPVIWQGIVLIIGLGVNIFVILSRFYKAHSKEIVKPIRHQKPIVNVNVDEKLLQITEERSDVPLKVISH